MASGKFRRRPRSAEVDTCFVHVLRTQARLGGRSFTVAGPRLWKCLPTILRRSDTELAEFKRLLKTHLFMVAETAAD